MPGLKPYCKDVAGTTRELRDHRFRLKQRRRKCNIRHHLFIDRSVLLWNSLTERVVGPFQSTYSRRGWISSDLNQNF